MHTGGPDRRRSTRRRSSSTGCCTDNTDIHQGARGGDRFQVAPETIAQREEDILRHFTDRITDAHLRVEIVEEHDNQGTRFIRHMTAKMARHDSTKMAAASTRAAQLRAHRAAGFADRTTPPLGFVFVPYCPVS